MAAGLVACSQTPEQKRDKHYARGMEYAAQGKASEAILEFRNAERADPNFGPVR